MQVGDGVFFHQLHLQTTTYERRLCDPRDSIIIPIPFPSATQPIASSPNVTWPELEELAKPATPATVLNAGSKITTAAEAETASDKHFQLSTYLMTEIRAEERMSHISSSHTHLPKVGISLWLTL